MLFNYIYIKIRYFDKDVDFILGSKFMCNIEQDMWTQQSSNFKAGEQNKDKLYANSQAYYKGYLY